MGLLSIMKMEHGYSLRKAKDPREGRPTTNADDATRPGGDCLRPSAVLHTQRIHPSIGRIGEKARPRVNRWSIDFMRAVNGIGGYAFMGQRWDMNELSLTDQAPRIVLQIEYNLIPSKKICRLVLPKMQGENKIHSFTIAIRFVSMSPHFDLSPSNSHGTTTVMRYACNTMSVARLPSCKHSLTNSHTLNKQNGDVGKGETRHLEPAHQ